MEEIALDGLDGCRCLPDSATGTGVVVVAGSSGRVDRDRARLLADVGVLTETFRWFGGPGQHDGPWGIALELFIDRVDVLARECDRVIVVGTSFGAEAALLTGAHSDEVSGVVAFAPSDVVWAGVTGDGRMSSHWTLAGEPLPYVPFTEHWQPNEHPPAFRGLYEASRARFPAAVAAATIPSEQVGDLVLVAGGDDRVWPSLAHAHTIQRRREALGLETWIVSDPEAGHRTVLPGEPVAKGGMRMQRGGTQEADARLGQAAWNAIQAIL